MKEEWTIVDFDGNLIEDDFPRIVNGDTLTIDVLKSTMKLDSTNIDTAIDLTKEVIERLDAKTEKEAIATYKDVVSKSLYGDNHDYEN